MRREEREGMNGRRGGDGIEEGRRGEKRGNTKTSTILGMGKVGVTATMA